MRVFIESLNLSVQAELARIFSQTATEQPDADSDTSPDFYQVIGSSSDPSFTKPKHIHTIINPSDAAELMDQILTCDIIVWDIFSDTCESTITQIHTLRETFENDKIFIGLSNTLMWTRTVTDTEDPDLPLLESDYKKRRSHLDYRSQINVEREVMRFGKDEKLKTFVICAGLVHHGGDSIFHYMFKQAWSGADVECYGNGENVLPVIHLDALCSIVIQTAQNKPVNRYVLAVDSAKSSLFDMCQAVSTALGTGNVKKVPYESCLLDNTVTKLEYELLKINLRLNSATLKEFPIPIKYESGFIENITTLVAEYKKSRNLSPVKVVVYGPPGIGKSSLCQSLSKHYSVPIINPHTLARNILSDYESRVGKDDDTKIETLLSQIKESMLVNNGEIPAEYIVGFVKQFMQTKPCLNQGYILDGCVFSVENVTKLFQVEGEDRDELTDNPEIVISLEASDKYLKQNTMALSEVEIIQKYGSEADYLKKLAVFRENDVPDLTVLNYFDENEVSVKNFDVEAGGAIEFMLQVIGKPRNYGPSREESERIQQEIVELKEQQDTIFAISEKEKHEQESIRRSIQDQEWQRKLQDIKTQEDEVLEAHAAPLRDYLMKYVMPVLSSGLVEVARVRPEDPVDYLAEFLFKAQAGIEEGREKVVGSV